MYFASNLLLRLPNAIDMESSKAILTKIFTEYYLCAAQAGAEGKPIAYVTAFAPVELLRAMGVVCVYPESYAVVCAASNKAPEMIQASRMGAFAQDLCSYSLLSFGAEYFDRLPYGGLPEPDILIATNNQCGTTLLWFKLLAQKKNLPLFIIDYPSSLDELGSTKDYIAHQYESLKLFIKEHTGGTLDASMLAEQAALSAKTCALWTEIHAENKAVPAPIDAERLINALFPIVVAKGTPRTLDYYQTLLNEIRSENKTGKPEGVRLLWHGYPMWFLPKKFPGGFDDDFRIVLNDYTLWWSLDYPDDADPAESLNKAYSNTYLNLSLHEKLDRIAALVGNYHIDGVICHANRSCRRALADIDPLRKALSGLGIPSVVIESDMANPDFFAKEQVALRIESFRDTLRVRR